MPSAPRADEARALESLLSFWTLSGVEVLYGDTPLDRTVAQSARSKPAATEPSRAPAPAAGAPPPTPPRTPSRPGVAAPPKPSAVDLEAIAKAQSAAAAAASLEDLKAAIAAFDGCPLKAGARQAVFSRGPYDAPIMAIGEAPGADEDAQGAPFVGRAGQLLDNIFAAGGLAGQVFITNTVFWRPPGNRTPTPEEQAVCAPFVERAIALLRPKLLLIIGGASAKALLKPTGGILSLRGKWTEWRSSDGAMTVPALPTLHPSFLLRQPAAKRMAWEDMQLLAERLADTSRGD